MSHNIKYDFENYCFSINKPSLRNFTDEDLKNEIKRREAIAAEKVRIEELKKELTWDNVLNVRAKHLPNIDEICTTAVRYGYKYFCHNGNAIFKVIDSWSYSVVLGVSTADIK